MNTLQLRLIEPRTRDAALMEDMYIRSFPEKERDPFDSMMYDLTGKLDPVGFYLNDKLIGHAFLLTALDMCHILYFAIEEEYQNQGFGSQALALMREFKKDLRIIADLERIEPGCPNPEQRLRRRNFYVRNGYHPTEVKYRWQDEDYIMYVIGGDLTPADFELFWSTAEKEAKEAMKNAGTWTGSTTWNYSTPL